LARENSGWGYDRIVGALANLGHPVSDQTVGNILRRHGIGPVPQRSKTTTWKDFIRRHMEVLAGIDFFTVEVLSWGGLVTYYVLFFIHLESRRVSIAGITDHPDACWMRQMACNAILEGIGDLSGCRYLLHDRDAKFCPEFCETLAAGGVKCLRLPPRSPNLMLRRYRGAGGPRSSVASAWAVSSSITIAGPHEFLDHTGSEISSSSQTNAQRSRE
jgi:hypothetical protein